MSKQPPTVQQVAAEAEFQLQAALDQLNWLTALACAIQLDHTHGRGKYADHLSEVAAFLSDTGFSGVHSALEEFRSLSESEPQTCTSTFLGVSGDEKTLGQRIQAARKRAGLTQPQLADRVGIRQGSLSQLEIGKSKRTSHLTKIAKALGVDTNWLAFGTECAQ